LLLALHARIWVSWTTTLDAACAVTSVRRLCAPSGLATLSVATPGCAVGPDFARPGAPAAAYSAPPGAIGTQNLDYGADVAADWYTLFRSEKLNAIVRTALAGNPDLEAARYSLRAAQLELRAVAGSAFPQLELDGRVSRSHVNGSLLYQPIDRLSITANQFSIGPALAYNLQSMNPNFPGFMEQVSQVTHASSSGTPPLAYVHQLAIQQAQLLSYLGVFKLFAVTFLMLLPLLLLVKSAALPAVRPWRTGERRARRPQRVRLPFRKRDRT
jgi:Outer membrane efflux protein